MSASGELPAIALSVDAALRGKVRVGLLAAGPVRVAPTDGALEQAIEGTSAELRLRLGGRPPAAIDGLGPARELYRAFGIDPTKTRPSSEKLLRRVLKGEGLPRISNAVDLANLTAVRLLLPIGLYDASKIEGGVTLRSGRIDELYVGTAGQSVHLAGRPVLADSSGPFGNPTADSARTAVCETTRALWLTVFAPESYPPERLGEGLAEAARDLGRHLADRAGPAPAVSVALAG